MRNKKISVFAAMAAWLWLASSVPVSAGDRGGANGHLPAGVQAVAQDDATPLYQIHENPYLRTVVTNWGYFGDYGRALIDSSTLGKSDTLPAPGFEVPAGSRIGYIYHAGLWVGGIVSGDTLVSTGTKDWPSAFEFHPEAHSPPVFSDTLGDEEYTSVYFDTLTDPELVSDDEIDGLHRPFPIKVRQTTRLVDDPLFDKGIILEVTVTNIGAQTIEDLWLGWYIDCDIWHPDNENSWLGDLSGYRTSTITLDGQPYDIAAAWSADNSGDPDSSGSFDERSPLGAFGAMMLECDPPLPEASFNWWTVAFSQAYDWGPGRNPADTNIDGGYGRAIGDAMRYRRMSNQEIDYDQVYAAIDYTADGWIPPTTASIAEDFADGYDTRFLQTRGSIDLSPNDSIVAVWTWVVGPNLHSDPAHFADTFDPENPDVYLSGLNFLPLDTALARMQQLWDSRLTDATVGPPKEFHITDWNDSTASMGWTRRSTHRLTGYEIYRSLDPTDFSDPPVAVLAPGEGTFTETGLAQDQTQYYTIRSVDNQGRQGIPSPVIDVLPDRPMRPTPLHAYRGNGEIRIEWMPPTEPDVVAHRVYRRLLGGGEWEFIGEAVGGESLTDGSAENATPYQYQIYAVSALGSESYPSSPILGIAFAFDGPPLVLDYTLSGFTSQTDKDSVAAVWQRLTAPVGAAYRDADPVTTSPFGLEVYNPHPVTFIVSDGREGPRPEWAEQTEYYLYGDGAAILSGRDLFNKDLITEGTLTFGPGDLAYDYFGITKAYYPRVLLSHPTRPNAEFIGARATDASLPELAVDSTRTAWGLHPALPLPGTAVPFVGHYEVDTARAEVVYTYVSRDSANSYSHGRAVGVVSKVPGVHAVALSFPLSYIEEPAAKAALIQLLRRTQWVGDMAGDLDGDTFVTVLDFARLIDYVMYDGYLANENNADVNGDCVIDMVDVVYLIDYIFMGGPAPVAGCVEP
jgi:hypothetical protein